MRNLRVHRERKSNFVGFHSVGRADVHLRHLRRTDHRRSIGSLQRPKVLQRSGTTVDCRLG